MQGKAFVFINWWQAAAFGHVGWGFSLDEDLQNFYFGSVDHLWRHRWWDLIAWTKYAHVPAHCHNDWWSSTGSRADMLQQMASGHHIRYHVAKELPVASSDPEAALKYAGSLADCGWSVLANNCVHHAYNVLTQFGAHIPAPASPPSNLIPKVWFGKLPGDTLELNPISSGPYCIRP